MAQVADPILTRSEMTGRVYVVTAYKRLDDGTIEARKKYDVTEQFEALVGRHGFDPADVMTVVSYLMAPPTTDLARRRCDDAARRLYDACPRQGGDTDGADR